MVIAVRRDEFWHTCERVVYAYGSSRSGIQRGIERERERDTDRNKKNAHLVESTSHLWFPTSQTPCLYRCVGMTVGLGVSQST